MTNEKMFDDWTNFPTPFKDAGLIDQRVLLLFMPDFMKNKTIEEIEALKLHTHWNNAEHIILVDSETHLQKEYLNLDDRVKVISPVDGNDPRLFMYPWWFAWQQEVESEVNFYQYLTQTDKKYVFDAMLGLPRPRRIWIANRIQSAQQEKFLWAIGTPWIDPTTRENFIQGHHLHNDQLSSFVEYNNKGHQCTNCTLMPYKVYNQSWFSIISDTPGYGIGPALTEKTGNCLQGLRLFINFGDAGLLKTLHKLGYKTFDIVIDESYDSITDEQQRFNTAWLQVEYLLQQDPVEIYNKVFPILEHNRQVFMDMDYSKNLIGIIQNALQHTA